MDVKCKGHCHYFEALKACYQVALCKTRFPKRNSCENNFLLLIINKNLISKTHVECECKISKYRPNGPRSCEWLLVEFFIAILLLLLLLLLVKLFWFFVIFESVDLTVRKYLSCWKSFNCIQIGELFAFFSLPYQITTWNKLHNHHQRLF